jgi:hypothetical protein
VGGTGVKETELGQKPARPPAGAGGFWGKIYFFLLLIKAPYILVPYIGHENIHSR